MDRLVQRCEQEDQRDPQPQHRGQPPGHGRRSHRPAKQSPTSARWPARWARPAASDRPVRSCDLGDRTAPRAQRRSTAAVMPPPSAAAVPAPPSRLLQAPGAGRRVGRSSRRPDPPRSSSASISSSRSHGSRHGHAVRGAVPPPRKRGVSTRAGPQRKSAPGRSGRRTLRPGALIDAPASRATSRGPIEVASFGPAARRSRSSRRSENAPTQTRSKALKSSSTGSSRPAASSLFGSMLIPGVREGRQQVPPAAGSLPARQPQGPNLAPVQRAHRSARPVSRSSVSSWNTASTPSRVAWTSVSRYR